MTVSSFQVLESRTLCSATPHVHAEPKPMPAPVDPAVLEADKAAITAALTKLQSDFAAASAAMVAARQVRVADVKSLNDKLNGLKAAVASDDLTMKTLGKAAETRTKAIYAKWSPIIGPEEKDVKTNTVGETAEERAADQAKLDSDRVAAQAELAASQAQAKSDRTAAETQMRTDKAAYDAARKAGEMQLNTDSKAISAAEKAVKTVFQSDRKVLDADLAQYRKDGGLLSDLHLPTMPKM